MSARIASGQIACGQFGWQSSLCNDLVFAPLHHKDEAAQFNNIGSANTDRINAVLVSSGAAN